MKKETMYAHAEAWLQEKGNISKATFCQRNRISQTQLSYWVTRYNKEFNRASKAEQPEFIPIEVKEEPTKKSKDKAKVKVEIEFPTGVILKIF